MENINNIYFKMEMCNPTGSIKDRIAKAMIFDFVQKTKNDLKYTIVEATSGNTGISVAMVCAAVGLKCKIYAPINTSYLKIRMMQAYGANVATVHETIAECIKCAKSLGDGRFHYYLDQFNNKCNIEAQGEMAGEARIQYNRAIFNTHWIETFHSPDAIVVGVGTGGTLMGLHKMFPKAKLFILQIPSGERIEGICDGVKLSLVPRKLQLNIINVTYIQAKLTTKWLTEKYGINCGISSGANYFGATEIQKKYDKILTVLPDNGDRYL